MHVRSSRSGCSRNDWWWWWWPKGVGSHSRMPAFYETLRINRLFRGCVCQTVRWYESTVVGGWSWCSSRRLVYAVPWGHPNEGKHIGWWVLGVQWGGRAGSHGDVRSAGVLWPQSDAVRCHADRRSWRHFADHPANPDALLDPRQPYRVPGNQRPCQEAVSDDGPYLGSRSAFWIRTAVKVSLKML